MGSQLIGNAKQNIYRLQRFQAFEIQIARLLGGWLPGIRRWEVKHEIGLHIWQNAENSRDLRTRLWELRVMNPDRGVNDVVIPAVKELARAQHDYELLAGLYLVLKPALLASYRTMEQTTYDIYDYPTIPVLKRIISVTETQIEWANRTLAELTDSGEKKRQTRRWMTFTKDVLASIAGVGGDEGESHQTPVPPPAYSSLLPFSEAYRDKRFKLQIQLPPMPDMEKGGEWTTWQFMGYATEMQAAETLATCLWEVEGMEWEFYYDIARHCWDEVRHSQLGCRRLEQLGYHISDFPHSVSSYNWRQLYDPVIRYCALTYVIEAGAFKLKHKSYQHYLEQNDLESAQAVMYDIIDETMHVRWGAKWVPPLMKHYGYTETLDELVEKCRDITAKYGTAAQKKAAERDMSTRRIKQQQLKAS